MSTRMGVITMSKRGIGGDVLGHGTSKPNASCQKRKSSALQSGKGKEDTDFKYNGVVFLALTLV